MRLPGLLADTWRLLLARALRTIGWREWVALPAFGIGAIKAKVDTGARSSALHAHGLRIERRDGVDVATFVIQPRQRSASPSHPAEALVSGWRQVTTSAGHRELRPVIVTTVELMGVAWPIELTLTRRDAMGFRMLLGRRAVRRRFVIDPGRSFLAGRPNEIT